MVTDTAGELALFAGPFYFVRHGETESNVLGIVAGSTDVPLTARGRTQALAAAEMLKAAGLTAVYSSSLVRARDTAHCIADALGLRVVIIPELAERNWGELEGKPRDLRHRGRLPAGADTPHQFLQRILCGLRKIDGGGVPLIVSHSGVFRVLSRLLGIPEAAAPVTNAQPVRFVPPAGNSPVWSSEVLPLNPEA
jgi:2,3-bisphosphoglycerate-dependent phosphoglycerate mutase